MSINKPNFLIVGAAKSGTSSLYNYLKQHPQIFMPSFKEPHFLVANKVKNKIHSYIEFEQEYFNLFKNTEKYLARGEASVFYLYYYEEAINNIKNYLGENIKIIILLRNPVDRAYSAYKHIIANNPNIVMTFEENLERELEFINKKDLTPMAHCKSMGLYYKMVKAYKNNFRHVHIITFNDFKKNTDKTVEEIFNFLNLDHYQVDTRKKYNKGKKSWKYNWISKIVIYNNIFKSIFKVLPYNNYIKKIIMKFITNEFQSINLETKKELINFYKEDINKLSKLLNVNLKKWTLINND